MKRKELFVDRDKMYALTQDTTGQMFIEVVVGGFAMENFVIPLNDEESKCYSVQGKPYLDDLADGICRDTTKYRARCLKFNAPSQRP